LCSVLLKKMTDEATGNSSVEALVKLVPKNTQNEQKAIDAMGSLTVKICPGNKVTLTFSKSKIHYAINFIFVI